LPGWTKIVEEEPLVNQGEEGEETTAKEGEVTTVKEGD
jgi:hypothetical protein